MTGQLRPVAQPGDFFTVRTGGWVASVIRKLTKAPVNHAGVYIGNSLVVEADPNGAKTAPYGNYAHAIWSDVPLTDLQRRRIVRTAESCVGTPYNFLDIAVLGVSLVLGEHTPKIAQRRLSRPDRLICSQLVDYCYTQAGVHLFSDGRLPSEVTPGDLYRLNHPDGA